MNTVSTLTHTEAKIRILYAKDRVAEALRAVEDVYKHMQAPADMVEKLRQEVAWLEFSVSGLVKFIDRLKELDCEET